jgi:glycosyltransferase involved in cell wall biosynthesis
MSGHALLFVFRSGLVERLAAVDAGSGPAEGHGFFALRRRGLEVDGVDETLRVDLLRRTFSRAYQRLYAIPRSGLGYRLHQAEAVRRHLRGDPHRIVVATADSVALPLLALRRRGSLPNPVVYLSIGLVDRLLRGDLHPGLAHRYRELAEYAKAVFAFTPVEVERLSEWVGNDRARLMPLGIDAEWWSAAAWPVSTEYDVLAFGRDDSRDFASFETALRSLSVDAAIVGTLARRQGLRPRSGLTVLDDVPVDRLRTLIHSARLVVVPARPASHGAGQTSALDAMAAGRPVVMTDTGWAAAVGLRPIEHYASVPPSDPEALGATIGRLLDAPEEATAMGSRAREHVREHLTTDAQADTLLAALEAT